MQGSDLMARSGWFLESHRHALASKGIETGRRMNPALGCAANPKTAPMTPYDYQDSHQEELIHSDAWEGANFRFVLEGAGDVFRELTKARPHRSCIEEKFARIEEHIKDEESGKIHPKDGLAIAEQDDKERLKELVLLWHDQPITRTVQLNAKELNLALIRGDWSEAKIQIDLIRSEADY